MLTKEQTIKGALLEVLPATGEDRPLYLDEVGFFTSGQGHSVRSGSLLEVVESTVGDNDDGTVIVLIRGQNVKGEANWSELRARCQLIA